jgi:triacylglycerol lipase
MFVALIGCCLLLTVDAQLTQHFQSWLDQNSYSTYNFARTDLGTTGSYGGKTNGDQQINNQPVIFIHGNSDRALNGGSSTTTGWSNSVNYFLGRGYSQAEIYATTWGDSVASNAPTRTHDCATVMRLRKFVEAVLGYTQAPKVDIISHSMGVTLGRKVVKGGALSASDGNCNVGSPLTDRVDAFLGLSGGNVGLCNCEGGSALIAATCGTYGFWPGDFCGFNVLDCGLNPLPFPCSEPVYADFLTKLNANPAREGSFVYSAWSADDDIIMYDNKVWGRDTSLIPGSLGHKVYSGLTHMQTKETTAADQYNAVVNHQI